VLAGTAERFVFMPIGVNNNFVFGQLAAFLIPTATILKSSLDVTVAKFPGI
jgi:hypothetical protein